MKQFIIGFVMGVVFLLVVIPSAWLLQSLLAR